MMSQFTLAAGGGAVALALGEGGGQGVGGAVADADGDTDGLGPGEAVGDALGLGPAGAVADAVGAGVRSAVGKGEGRSLLVAAVAPPPALEADAVTAGPVVADAVAVGPTQGPAGLLDELRRVLACGKSSTTRAAATTMASTAISAGYVRLRSSLWPRLRRAARRKDRPSRYGMRFLHIRSAPGQTP
jgi:hypothetical protein